MTTETGPEKRSTRKGLPSLRHYPGTLYIPASPCRDLPGNARYSGGLFDQGRRAIRDGFLWRGRERMSHAVKETPIAEIPDKTLYLGWMFPAYGHVLLESLSRCWAIGQSEAKHFVFHAPEVNELPSFAAEFLSALGVRKEQILLLQAPTLFSDLEVPAPALEIRRAAFFKDATTTLYERIAGPADKPDDTPVYVSRSLLPLSKRALVGETILEEALAAQGFDIIHPEAMTLSEQLAVFRNRNLFVGALGSAMHNIVFNRRKARIAYLTSKGPSSNYVLCDEIAGAQSIFARCCDLDDLPYFGRETPLRLNLSAAIKQLAGAGLAHPTDLTGRQNEIDASYRQCWARARLEQGLKRRQGPEALAEVRMHFKGSATAEIDLLMAKCHDDVAPKKRGKAA